MQKKPKPLGERLVDLGILTLPQLELALKLNTEFRRDSALVEIIKGQLGLRETYFSLPKLTEIISQISGMEEKDGCIVIIMDYLYEAKLLLVGEERVGKSTIAKALSEKNFKIDSEEDSTVIV